MKINSVKGFISFKKSLVANCSVLHTSQGSIPCSVYKLSEKEDSDYFELLPNKTDWDDARYLCYLMQDLKVLSDFPYFSIYTLENKRGDCLGYTEIAENSNDSYEILLLETAPKFISKNTKSTKQYRYIGETLIAFLAKKSMKEKKSFLDVEPSVTAEQFYTHNCFFKKPKDNDNPYFLQRSKYKKIIAQNEKHTSSKIRFVG